MSIECGKFSHTILRRLHEVEPANEIPRTFLPRRRLNPIIRAAIRVCLWGSEPTSRKLFLTTLFGVVVGGCPPAAHWTSSTASQFFGEAFSHSQNWAYIWYFLHIYISLFLIFHIWQHNIWSNALVVSESPTISCLLASKNEKWIMMLRLVVQLKWLVLLTYGSRKVPLRKLCCSW